MPSSTSSSNAISRRHIIALLAMIAIFCAGVEFITRAGYSRISRIRRQMVTEYAAARADKDPSSILIVGNSLLKEGVEMERLRQSLGDGCSVQRFAVDGTTYLDWYYGLRHLFSQGARPRAVVLVMSSKQWLATEIRGDYSAGLILNRADVPHIAADVNADHTATSNLFFATCSSYYANRGEIRKWLLGMVLPGMQSFTARFPVPRSPLPSDDIIETRATPRLIAMNELCRQNGVRFIMVIPPTNTTRNGASAMLAAAARAKVQVLMPIDESHLTDSEYSDGFHLNARGRTIFTDAFALRIRELLASAGSMNRAE
jgi:hypothetical protein